MKQVQERRSQCPINFSLEMIGDAWSLLIIRDIIYSGKKTYGEFLESGEGIARNILATRLMQLQQKGLLKKRDHPTDRRKDMYELTTDGLDVIPILLDMAEWGSKSGDTTSPLKWLEAVRAHREEIIPLIRTTVLNGGSVFNGPDSVVDKISAKGWM
ncbi:winged helix-turn-helix transcriptional regulator [Cohnella nanjingensis]|uniref:Helix-turn-helix transcriptional regulator n=1 Tax=Cohnella nanjingensis TaxID=1387779 RepID=A0A7X0RU16_9BACL|nr:helix-turn-helix domain-containing protein [Cohnella nanjingensis]MBB6673664.1 helix-turn-helix transcriptional regulator [Cohnella nanjingensis]